MKNNRKSNYDNYFESLAFHLNKLQQPFANSLDIMITKPDGYVKFTLIINLNNIAFQEIKDKPFFTIWSDWDPNNPLVRNVSTYFHTTRLKYYTGKEDINRNLAIAPVAIVGLGIIFVLLIHINFLRSMLLIVILLMGAIALSAAITGLLAVRLGLLEKYICDVANCTAWIPIR